MTRHYVVGWVFQDKLDDAPHLRVEQFRGAEEVRAWVNALPVAGVRWRVYELVEVPEGRVTDG